MVRRLTIVCGLVTLAVVLVLAMQDHSLFGARSSHRGPTQVTAIQDRPAVCPPVKPVPPTPPLKGLPPAPQPQSLRHAPVHASPAAGSAGTTIKQVANALLNLPKILGRALTRPSDDH